MRCKETFIRDEILQSERSKPCLMFHSVDVSVLEIEGFTDQENALLSLLQFVFDVSGGARLYCTADQY